jgi:hypothetical protein
MPEELLARWLISPVMGTVPALVRSRNCRSGDGCSGVRANDAPTLSVCMTFH